MKLTHTLISASLALAAGFAAAQTAVQAVEPWARPTVQGQGVGGGYVRIVGGAADDRLLSARADIAGRVELHAMSMDGDVMRMRRLDGIDIPAGRTVELKPGALHLMLVALKRPLKAGSTFPLTLKFAKAGEVKVDVKVQAEPAAAHRH